MRDAADTLDAVRGHGGGGLNGVCSSSSLGGIVSAAGESASAGAAWSTAPRQPGGFVDPALSNILQTLSSGTVLDVTTKGEKFFTITYEGMSIGGLVRARSENKPSTLYDPSKWASITVDSAGSMHQGSSRPSSDAGGVPGLEDFVSYLHSDDNGMWIAQDDKNGLTFWDVAQDLRFVRALYLGVIAVPPCFEFFRAFQKNFRGCDAWRHCRAISASDTHAMQMLVEKVNQYMHVDEVPDVGDNDEVPELDDGEVEG